MHAVVVSVTIADGQGEATAEFLNSQVIPMVKQSPGFVSGLWAQTNNRTSGTSIAMYDSAENAEAAAAMARSIPIPPSVSNREINVGLVVAQA